METLTSADLPTPPEPRTTSLYSRILYESLVCVVNKKKKKGSEFEGGRWLFGLLMEWNESEMSKLLGMSGRGIFAFNVYRPNWM